MRLQPELGRLPVHQTLVADLRQETDREQVDLDGFEVEKRNEIVECFLHNSILPSHSLLVQLDEEKRRVLAETKGFMPDEEGEGSFEATVDICRSSVEGPIVERSYCGRSLSGLAQLPTALVVWS